MAHRKLDAAVCAAYGWDAGVSDEETLARLLSVNLGRPAVGDSAPEVEPEEAAAV